MRICFLCLTNGWYSKITLGMQNNEYVKIKPKTPITNFEKENIFKKMT